MSESEKSSGSVHPSESASSGGSVHPSESASSGGSFFFDSSSSSGSGSGGGGGGGGGGGDSGSDDGGGGDDCPLIYNITVALYSIGENEDHPLCFRENDLTPCQVIVSFDVEPFDAGCDDNHLLARVNIAGGNSAVPIYNVGGNYQIEWMGVSLPRLNLFPNTTYNGTICIERTVGTPVECTVPNGCCANFSFTSPLVCECDYFIENIRLEVIAGPGNSGWFTVQNDGATVLYVTGYNGPGTPADTFPVIIPAGGSYEFLIFEFGDSLPGQPFTISTSQCGESSEGTWPGSYPP